MTPVLSVLVPTIPQRHESFSRLYLSLMQQAVPSVDVEVLVLCDKPQKDGGRSLGEKRDILISRATGEYVVFIDDDDAISKTYTASVLTACQSSPDAIGVKGKYFKDGEFISTFHHSSQFPGWGIRGSGEMIRPLNHTNPIKRSIAEKVKHQHIYFREDLYWSLDLMASGLVQSETDAKGIILEYRYVDHPELPYEQ